MSHASPLHRIEEYLHRKEYSKAVPLLLRRYGTKVTITRKTSDYSVPQVPTNIEETTRDIYSVYGSMSNVAAAPLDPFTPDQDPDPQIVRFDAVLLIGHALFNVTDDTFAQDFADNYIFAPETVELLPGDYFTVDRSDGLRKSWKVVEPLTVGSTRVVLRKYKVIATGEV